MILPIVDRETALTSLADLIRAEMELPEDDDSGSALLDAICTVASENQEIIGAVQFMLPDGCSAAERRAAFVGMAVTYRVLTAQAEIQALGELAAL